MDPTVQVALIAGLASLVTAVVSIVLTTRAQGRTDKSFRERDAAATKAKTETDAALLRLGASLNIRHDREAALTDYTYDALKRLYSDVNPLLFRLREESAGSILRIRRIVREDIRVDTDRHLLTSTQRLTAPLVLAEELQRHLTAVDLRLDPTIRAQYIVSRELLWTLHGGTGIAAADPELPYRPLTDERKEPRQHLTFAQLQRLVEVFTQTDADGLRRPLRLSELEDRRNDGDVAAVLARMRKLFSTASASTTPVLWRLLLAQASLLSVLVDLVDRSSDTVERVLPIDIEEFRWRSTGGRSFDSQVAAVDAYLRTKLTRAGIQFTTRDTGP